MDTNTITVAILFIILLIIIESLDAAIPLLCMAFLIMFISINFISIFGILPGSMGGWGLAFMMAYWVLDIYCFLIILTSGIELKRNHAKHD